MDVLDGSFQTDLGTSATAFLPGDQPSIFYSLGNAIEDLFGAISRALPELVTGIPPPPTTPRPWLGGAGTGSLMTWLLIAGGVYLVMRPAGRRSSRRNPRHLSSAEMGRRARLLRGDLSPATARRIRAMMRSGADLPRLFPKRRRRRNPGPPGAIIQRLLDL